MGKCVYLFGDLLGIFDVLDDSQLFKSCTGLKLEPQSKRLHMVSSIDDAFHLAKEHGAYLKTSQDITSTLKVDKPVNWFFEKTVLTKTIAVKNIKNKSTQATSSVLQV